MIASFAKCLSSGMLFVVVAAAGCAADNASGCHSILGGNARLRWHVGPVFETTLSLRTDEDIVQIATDVGRITRLPMRNAGSTTFLIHGVFRSEADAQGRLTPGHELPRRTIVLSPGSVPTGQELEEQFGGLRSLEPRSARFISFEGAALPLNEDHVSGLVAVDQSGAITGAECFIVLSGNRTMEMMQYQQCLVRGFGAPDFLSAGGETGDGLSPIASACLARIYGAEQ